VANAHDKWFNLLKMNLRDTPLDKLFMIWVDTHPISPVLELNESNTNCIPVSRSIAPSIEM